jgi:3-dehydroquinate synthase
MQTLETALPYSIHIGEGLLFSSHLVEVCRSFDRCFLFSDTTVYELHGCQFRSHLHACGVRIEQLLIPPGEAQKTREQKAQLEDALLASGCTRRSLLIALGGGVLTDLIGFVGATFHRGISVLYIPTTLLAMVDAAIGGKTGVNTIHGKNLIGCFSPPHSVWIDPFVLKTLPERELRSGWGEVAKHALLGDPLLWSELVRGSIKTIDWGSLLASSCGFKASIVAQDEREQGLRAVLNLGHTVGHALEQACGYELSHGACVAVGLWVESFLGATFSVHPLSLFQEIAAWVQRVFPEEVAQAQRVSWGQLHPFLQQDKKGTTQGCPLVLLQKVGVPWKGDTGWIFWAPYSTVEVAWTQFRRVKP